MNYQQLNGFTDWFDDAVTSASVAINEASDWVGAQVSDGYDWSVKLGEELTDDTVKKFEEFEAGVESLMSKQSQVDQAIESLAENSPLRKRLESQRAESRGYFQNYVLPAWNTFSDWVAGRMESNNQMGALPLVGLAAVVGAVAVGISYVYSAHALEDKILNDPELKAQYAVGKVGQAASIASAVKYGAMAIGGLVLFNLVKSFKN